VHIPTTKDEDEMADNHYVKVSDEVWKELVRIQKLTKVDKHALVDDIIALAGDLEAIAERHELFPEKPVHSTRAAVLEPSAAEQLTLEDLI
jgi:hypothetical protein